ncbi:MarR family transcriptional regulator [Chloroflexota bacterium]
MGKSEEVLTRHILKVAAGIYNLLSLGISMKWLSSNLTGSQLRSLLILHTDDPSRMSAIVSVPGVALSTATGIVDNLIRKEMVVREADPTDRRLVICR